MPVQIFTSGHEFESAIIAELYKQTRSLGLTIPFYHYRTYDGKEIDLLIELGNSYLAFEIKMTDHVSKTDARNFSDLGSTLDKPLKKCIILSNDPEIKFFGENTIAIPAAWFLT